MKPTEMKERIKLEYNADVEKTLLTNALVEVKKSLSFNNHAFCLVSSFLNTIERTNEGTTARILSIEGVFHRAFLCPGICARAFSHTPKIVGLDACHIKARYG